MKLKNFSVILTAMTTLGLLADAGTASADEHKAKVSFSLNSDRYRIEYTHTSGDSLEAQDQAMYHAAHFILRQGQVEFKVEDVFTYSPDWQDYDARYEAHMDCGTFACAKRLPAEQEASLNSAAQAGEIIVVIDLVGGRDMANAPGARLNVGPIINAQRGIERPLMMADSGTLTASP